jgi:hypothetical protein
VQQLSTIAHNRMVATAAADQQHAAQQAPLLAEARAAKRAERQQRLQGGKLTAIRSTTSMQVQQQVRRITTGCMTKGRALSLTGAAEPPPGKRSVQLLGGIPAAAGPACMHVPASDQELWQQQQAQQQQQQQQQQAQAMEVQVAGAAAAPLLQPAPLDDSALVVRMLLSGALHDQELGSRRAQQAALFGRR